MLNQFKNLSCYEEFEILCTLTGISKIDVLKEIGHKIDNYYFFVSEDGIFNWCDLTGNHVKDTGVLKELKNYHIPKTITKCTIPNGVTNIGDSAFSFCESLTSITMYNNVTNIGDYAFYFCDSLKEITIPNNVTSIGNYTFCDCRSLTSITIPDSVTNIGEYAFYKCKLLTSIIISNSVTHIGPWTFTWCDTLKEVIFKGKTLEEVKQIENYPFGINDESIIKCI